MTWKTAAVAIAAGFALATASAYGQTSPPLPTYGSPITLAQAKKIAEAAVAASPKLSSQPDVVAIVDSGANLICLERMDNAHLGSVRVAIEKARSAVLFRRPSKVFGDLVGKGNNVLLGLHGASVLEGGLPILVGGKIVGGIGVSGGTGPEDGKVAAAALEAAK
jgi:glc operon protein GlcG